MTAPICLSVWSSIQSEFTYDCVSVGRKTILVFINNDLTCFIRDFQTIDVSCLLVCFFSFFFQTYSDCFYFRACGPICKWKRRNIKETISTMAKKKKSAFQMIKDSISFCVFACLSILVSINHLIDQHKGNKQLLLWVQHEQSLKEQSKRITIERLDKWKRGIMMVIWDLPNRSMNYVVFKIIIPFWIEKSTLHQRSNLKQFISFLPGFWKWRSVCSFNSVQVKL